MSAPDAAEPISYGQRVSQLAASDPEKVALVFAALDRTEQVLTWNDLDRRSNQVARALAARGVGPADRVSIALANSPDLVAAALATWKLGAVPVPVRWDLPDWERQRVLEVIDARLDLRADDVGWLAETVADDDAPVPGALSPQTHGICSSGSTGTPKVIVIDRPAVYADTMANPLPAEWDGVTISRPQVMLVPAPLYHTNGFLALNYLLGGDRLVLMEKFDAALVVDLIERHGITAITATPTMLQRIADLPDVDDRDLSSIEWVLQGAAVMPPSLVHRWISLIGAEHLFMVYGMTEGLGFTGIRADEWLEHPGSVGRGLRGTELRILDDDGRQVAPDELGEIHLRAPSGGLYRYLGQASRLSMTEDGFGSAGDIGRVDEDGYLYIADRRSDLIITGGANVYPAEVESALIEHPAVADVVVIGLADPEWGRRVHAIIEPADPADPPADADIIAFAKSRLAPYKVPKTVELVDRVPRSEATKVSRSALVEARGG